MLVPIGHDKGIRHAPWMTATLLVALLVIEMWRVAKAPSTAEWRDAERQRAYAEAAVLHVVAYGERKPSREGLRQHVAQILTEGHDPQMATFLDRVRDGTVRPRGAAAQEVLAELDAADASAARLARRDPAVQLAFRPADGLTPRVLVHAIVHADGWQLLGVLLFLWLVGCNLEDRWGRLAFGGLLAAGAVVTAAAYAAFRPGAEAGIVGGSGAGAAAMGAFCVSFWDARIRFAFATVFPRPRVGTFESRALFALPLWLVGQVLHVVRDPAGPLAPAAVVQASGFVLGVLVAAIVRATGRERAPAEAPTWTEHPAVVAALDHVNAGRPRDAAKVLAALLERQPQHRTARQRLAALALTLGDEALLQAHLGEALCAHGADDHPEETVRLYRAAVGAHPGVFPGDRALLEVTKAAGAIGDLAVAEAAALRLADEQPGASLAPGALWTAARALDAHGASERAAALRAELGKRFPDDPLATRTAPSVGIGDNHVH